jgi:hypothetical protein
VNTHKFSPKTPEAWDLGLEVCTALAFKNQIPSMPISVIAEACECSETAVYHVEQRAIRKLRAGLAAKMPGLFSPESVNSLLGPKNRRKNARRNAAL